MKAAATSRRRAREMRAARAAGWRRSELWWERLQERANALRARRQAGAAARRFLLAWLLARLAFGTADARYATSLANLAVAARERGAESVAARRARRARALWTAVPASLGALRLAPRARSSLFHLRLEARERERYRAATERRLARFVAESAACLEALAANRPAPYRRHALWRGARPAQFDDARRLLGACLLLATDAPGARATATRAAGERSAREAAGRASARPPPERAGAA